MKRIWYSGIFSTPSLAPKKKQNRGYVDRQYTSYYDACWHNSRLILGVSYTLEPFRSNAIPKRPINTPPTGSWAVCKVCATFSLPMPPERKNIPPKTNSTRPIEFSASFFGGYDWCLFSMIQISTTDATVIAVNNVTDSIAKIASLISVFNWLSRWDYRICRIWKISE